MAEESLSNAGALSTPMAALDDTEGNRVPDGCGFVVDAHVHLFPDRLFASVRRWFDVHGWPIRYKIDSRRIIKFLHSVGVSHVVALQYAHRPGIAEKLNAYMTDICREHLHVTGIATVFPGEKDSRGILARAFLSGLSGVKLHAHVQCFDMESDAMQQVYDVCSENEKPLIMHVGREPKSPAYACDPYRLCSAAKLERVVRAYPRLKVCVPHMGADEFDAYKQLIERYDNLWLDTTMMLAGYFPDQSPPDLLEMRSDRVMYGSDFPNIPYAWDRELKRIVKQKWPGDLKEKILGKNAAAFYGIERTAECGRRTADGGRQKADDSGLWGVDSEQ